VCLGYSLCRYRNILNGGYGCIFRTCFASYERLIGVRQEDIATSYLKSFIIANTRLRAVWEVPGQLPASGAKQTAQRQPQAKAPREKNNDLNSAANGWALG
jgi:hypothetical protein